MAPIGFPGVAGSLPAFVLVYIVVFGAGVYYLLRLMRAPPTPSERIPDEGSEPFTRQRTGIAGRREGDKAR